MKTKTLNLLILSLLVLLINSCNSNQSIKNNRIIIGISADVQTFNSLFAFSYVESTIADLLYPGLMDFRWDDKRGVLETGPMIAKSWQWSDDSSYIKFILRDDVYWSDGEKLTTDDVIFSYDVYSDPDVQSRLLGTFDYYYTDENGKIDIEKTFNVTSSNEFEIHFPPNSVVDLVEVSVPIIPEHIFSNISREELESDEVNFRPVSSGAFKLKRWDRNQTIILEADSNSFLFTSGQTAELVFKVVPDYTSRILQLKKGDIDLVESVKVEDIDELKSERNLSIINIVGREYDYVGWNNIDPELFAAGEVKPNKLFGSSNVRKALTMAINRQEILDEYLLDLGELAVSPVSPIFKSEINNKIKPYEYNPDEAKKLLAQEGWTDIDRNGILEKSNDEFKFTMYYPVGNPLREYASVVVKNNLKSVGVDVTIERMELGTFIDNLYDRKLNSWMAGWGVPIPLELKPFWYSDPNIGVLNFACYGNAEVDSILDRLDTKISSERKSELVKLFQKIVHENEPVSFLYWTPNIVAHNKRIENIRITPYGALAHCWEWTLNE
jgi:peptide/nickel transport system substrate-binding protein